MMTKLGAVPQHNLLQEDIEIGEVGAATLCKIESPGGEEKLRRGSKNLGYICLLTEDGCCMVSVAHEAVHAAVGTLKTMRLLLWDRLPRLDVQEEFIAYITGSIVDQIAGHLLVNEQLAVTDWS